MGKAIFILLSILGLGVLGAIAQNPPPIIKIAYGGSYIVVPKEKIWKIDRAFVNEGGSYNIQISNRNFKEEYAPGDTLRVPYYVAEMELLSENATAVYQLYILERERK